MTQQAPESAERLDALRLASSAMMVLLALFCIAWELWLAPLRPGAWLLSLKAVPVILAVPGFMRGHLRTYQWWSMIILFYMTEGLVRGASDPGVSAWLGWIEAAMSVLLFCLILAYCRRRLRLRAPATAGSAAKR